MSIFALLIIFWRLIIAVFSLLHKNRQNRDIQVANRYRRFFASPLIEQATMGACHKHRGAGDTVSLSIYLSTAALSSLNRLLLAPRLIVFFFNPVLFQFGSTISIFISSLSMLIVTNLVVITSLSCTFGHSSVMQLPLYCCFT